jgi:hypothetical protein
MIRYPLAGNMMAFFHYVYGLNRLGHQVLYLEESGWSESCYDAIADSYSNDPSHGLATLRDVMARFGVRCPVAYVDRATGSTFGLSWAEIRDALRAADLLLNVGGVCWLDEFRACRRRALVDMDPFFTQIGSFGLEGLGEYHAHFTYGANVGAPGCRIPSNTIPWIPTVPPVAVELWRPVGRAARAAALRGPLTTIANWSAYGDVTHEGEQYGQKDREFRRMLSLPARVPVALELALGGADDATKADFGHAGWRVRDALDVSRDLEAYQSYIASSRGEFSMAKHAYVKTRSGWFSDRTVCYLACGRPVVVQDSGFSDWLPTGRGVLAFSSMEEAAACIEQVNADFDMHAGAAEEIAARTFGCEQVLPRLVQRALAG